MLRLPRIRLPRPAAPAEDGRIPLPPLVQVGFGVLFNAGTNELAPETLKAHAGEVIVDWLGESAEEPLRAALFGYLARGWLRIEVQPRDAHPVPSLELLKEAGFGEWEEQRYRSATHLMILSGADALVYPRVGFWSAVGAARAVADCLSGVILDPELPRLVPITESAWPLPGDARIRAAEHLLVTHAGRRDGLLTRGMCKFGLPDLRIPRAESSQREDLAPVLLSFAEALIAGTMEQAFDGATARRALELGPELFRSRLAPAPLAVPESWVRSVYQTSTAESPAYLDVLPPAAEEESWETWLCDLAIAGSLRGAFTVG
jgi:hypothetical protein